MTYCDFISSKSCVENVSEFDVFSSIGDLATIHTFGKKDDKDFNKKILASFINNFSYWCLSRGIEDSFNTTILISKASSEADCIVRILSSFNLIASNKNWVHQYYEVTIILKAYATLLNKYGINYLEFLDEICEEII